jgi:hypothetical protein
VVEKTKNNLRKVQIFKAEYERKGTGRPMSEATREFRYMIDKALDRQELETLRDMIVHVSDLTLKEREELLRWLGKTRNKAKDERSTWCVS